MKKLTEDACVLSNNHQVFLILRTENNYFSLF